jgi:hypothetical protein
MVVVVAGSAYAVATPGTKQYAYQMLANERWEMPAKGRTREE